MRYASPPLPVELSIHGGNGDQSGEVTPQILLPLQLERLSRRDAMANEVHFIPWIWRLVLLMSTSKLEKAD